MEALIASRAGGLPTMTEQWTPIPGFDGYELSDWGRVRSWVKPGRGTALRDEPKILKPWLSSRGYYFYSLRGKGVSLEELYMSLHPEEDMHILLREIPDWQEQEIRELEGVRPAHLVAREFALPIERVRQLWNEDTYDD